jgi:hypothetical protein
MAADKTDGKSQFSFRFGTGAFDGMLPICRIAGRTNRVCKKGKVFNNGW